ncbi:hypothetical protein ABT158_22400 [Nonomuraea sp. NPDC001636]|uniref:hypothetical protein n=1 Tax=Nonomuraea sp. NPDC001636 TaxID=3154391 RepID=UPI00331E62DE
MRTLLTRTATLVASAVAALALAAPAHAASDPVKVALDMSGTPSTALSPAPNASTMSSGDPGIPGELPALDYTCEGRFTDSGHMTGWAICSTMYDWEVGVFCNDGSYRKFYPEGGVARFDCYGAGGISRVFATIWYR